MRLRAAALAFLPAILWVAASCGGGSDGDNAEAKAREGLPTMTLQQYDLPEGLQPIGNSFSTNEDAASGLGGGPSLQQLQAWGRILGYEARFQAGQPSEQSAITAISSSVSLYKAAQGASDSFTDRVNAARRADWKASHSDLTDFQQQELKRQLPVDDMLWLRFTGHKQSSPTKNVLIADDQIVFRVDRVWGYLNPISAAAPGVDDRDFMLAEIESLVRKQIEHMRNGLNSVIVE